MTQMMIKENATKPSRALSEILAHISDETIPLSSQQLGELSDLNAEELKTFNCTWGKISTERKLKILSRLDELAKSNVEFNFDRIFRNAIYCPDSIIRQTAIECLWENSDTSLLQPLLRIVTQDPSTEVRCVAATALGRFAMLAEHQKVSADKRDRILKTLLEILANEIESSEVRRRALVAISPISVPAVTQAIQTAYNSQDPQMRIGAISAMGQNCDQQWLQYILLEMESAIPEMRYEAAIAAGEMGEPVAITQLINLTNDSDSDVRLSAITALGKIGGFEVKKHLNKLLKHKSQAVREVAEQAIAEIELLEIPVDKSPDETGMSHTI